MRVSGIVVAAVSLFLLTGFNSAKFDTLVENCVKKGMPRNHCVCSFILVKNRVGTEFLEAVHLQVSGQTTAYTLALALLIGHDPNALQKVADAQAEAKKICRG